MSIGSHYHLQEVGREWYTRIGYESKEHIAMKRIHIVDTVDIDADGLIETLLQPTVGYCQFL